MNYTKILGPIVVVGASLLAFQNCSPAGFGTDAANFNSLNVKYGDPPICDPLSGTKSPTLGKSNGLMGRLIYDTAANIAQFGTVRSFAELAARGKVARAQIFMASVNVAPRPFTEGFSAEGQPPLVDDTTNEKLIEWFGIDMVSVIKLTAGDSPGYYQLATYTDDGSLLDVVVDGKVVPLINNDGSHSPRAVCASVSVYLDAKTTLPIHYRYYQGPKTTIASVMSWRKVGTANPDVSQCTQVNTNAGGWAPIPAKNFFLPEDAPENPCN